jgi:hypothetical protein
MKRVVVTPAGRKRYLSILLKNLLKCRDEFDCWDIWVNTENEDDISYILDIQGSHDFIKAVFPKKQVNTQWPGLSIHQFFNNCVDKDAMYLRLDDDIVFIKKGSIDSVFKRRELSTDNFLIYGNTLNNVLMSFLQQRVNYMLTHVEVGYNPLDPIGWSNGKFAEDIHRLFFEKHTNGEIDYFNLPDVLFSKYEHVSINAICWRGDEFAKFNGIVDEDEERWLCCVKTKELEKPNLMIGDTLFVHYAYYTQRTHVDSTDILSLYEKL